MHPSVTSAVHLQPIMAVFRRLKGFLAFAVTYLRDSTLCSLKRNTSSVTSQQSTRSPTGKHGYGIVQDMKRNRDTNSHLQERLTALAAEMTLLKSQLAKERELSAMLKTQVGRERKRGGLYKEGKGA